MTRLILASKSPRRIKLLEQLGFKFEIIPSRLKEIPDASLSPDQVVLELSAQKAESVAAGRTDTVVVAADTIVVKDGTVLGQPADKADAAAMLRNLSGTSHYVFTGVTIVRIGHTAAESVEKVQFHERTKVTFTSLTEQEIDAYVHSGSPMDKAGAYGIQDDWGSVFVSGIQGDYYNVVGFPVHKFYQAMKQVAPEIISKTRISNDPEN